MVSPIRAQALLRNETLWRRERDEIWEGVHQRDERGKEQCSGACVCSRTIRKRLARCSSRSAR